jgi:four helix bundle protein
LRKFLLVERKYDLDERLIDFAAGCIDIAEALPKTVAGNHVAGQLIRSSTSPCFQYGEAQSAESQNDFVHKMKVGLKELRETYNCLRLIKKKCWYHDGRLNECLDENDQLIAMFIKCIQTSLRRKQA